MKNNIYKDIYDKISPSEELTLKTKDKVRKFSKSKIPFTNFRIFYIKGAAALVLIVAVISTVISTAVLSSRLISNRSVTGTGSKLDDTDITSQVAADTSSDPVTSEPKGEEFTDSKLTVRTLSASSAGGTYTMDFENCVDASLVNITDGYNDPDHKYHKVYFDSSTKTVYCLTHMLEEILPEELYIHKDDILIEEYGQDKNKALVAPVSDLHAYYIDFETKSYKKLPLQFGDGREFITVNKEYTKFVTTTHRGDLNGYYDVWITDIITGEDKNILFDGEKYLYNALSDIKMSTKGKFVDILVDNPENPVALPKRHVLYDPENSKHHFIDGNIIAFVKEDRYVVYEDNNDKTIKMMDTQTDTVLENDSWPRLDVYEYYSFSEENRYIYRKDWRTGTDEKLIDGKVDGFTLSGSKQYAYYYISGQNKVNCIDIGTKEITSYSIGSEFAEEIANLENKSDISYLLYPNIEGNELLLCYYKDTAAGINNNPGNLETYELYYYIFSECNSLSEIYGQIRNNNWEYKVYGDSRFSVIEFSFRDQFDKSMLVAVEDYRNHTLVTYRHRENKYFSIEAGYTEEKKYHLLQKGIQNDLTFEKFRKAVGYDMTPYSIDYSQFYTNGYWDDSKAASYEFNKENTMENAFYVMCTSRDEKYNGLPMFENYDLSKLSGFFELVEKQSYHAMTSQEINMFENAETKVYLSVCDRNGEELYYAGYGIAGGKYCLRSPKGFAYITKGVYDELKSLYDVKLK